jgi:hypothetical protein
MAAGGERLHGHFGCTCYHPLFVFNQLGDLERCVLRPAMCTRPTADVEYWNRSCRATGARERGYIFGATRPSPTRRSTSSWKSKAWATRSGCQPQGLAGKDCISAQAPGRSTAA